MIEQPMPETIANKSAFSLNSSQTMMIRLLKMRPPDHLVLPQFHGQNITIGDYKKALEKNFTEEMNWDNLNMPGGWTIGVINQKPDSNSVSDINNTLHPNNVIPLKLGDQNETFRQNSTEQLDQNISRLDHKDSSNVRTKKGRRTGPKTGRKTRQSTNTSLEEKEEDK